MRSDGSAVAVNQFVGRLASRIRPSLFSYPAVAGPVAISQSVGQLASRIRWRLAGSLSAEMAELLTFKDCEEVLRGTSLRATMGRFCRIIIRAQRWL